MVWLDLSYGKFGAKDLYSLLVPKGRKVFLAGAIWNS